MVSSWKKISSKVVYKSPYFEVRRDKVINPNGENSIYHLVDVVGAVAIVALDAQNRIYLLREEKYLPGVIWTVPAGKIEKNDKNFLASAKRELKEEAGLTAKKWVNLGRFLAGPGHSTGVGYCFLAQDLKEGKQDLDPTERIEIIKVPFQKAVAMIKKGEILDAWAIIPIFKTKLHLSL